MKNLSIYILTSVLLTLASCQKDPYLGGMSRVEKIDLNDVQPSFIEYQESTYEISLGILQSDVVEKTDHFIAFNANHEVFDSIDVGSIIVSPRYTPFEQMLFRKVVAKELTGGVVRYQTEPAKIHEAYSTWHFDTRDGFFLGNKRSADIIDLSYLNTVISNATFIETIKGVVESFVKQNIHNDSEVELKVTPNISGGLDFIYGDINAEYLSVIQEGSTSPVDTDNDGVIDAVEIELGTDPSNSQSYPPSSGIRMRNFAMDAEFQVTLAYQQSIETKDLDYRFNDYDPTEKDQLFNELDSTINAKIAQYPGFSQLASIVKNEYLPKIDKSPATYHYFPTPATIGAATVTLVLSPYISFSGKVVGGVGVKLSNMNDPFTMDVVFGDSPSNTEVTYYRDAGQTNTDLSQNIFTVPLTESLYSLFNLDVLAFAEGETEFTFGFAFGAALSFGEPNTAGWNIGFAFIPNCGPKITGKAITMPLNIVSEYSAGIPLLDAVYNNSRIEACLDINAYLPLKVFNDVNDPFTQDLLDIGLEFNSDPIFKFSDISGTAICIPPLCTDIDYTKIHTTLLESSLAINNENRNSLSTYDLKLTPFSDSSDLLINSPDIAFSTDHNLQLSKSLSQVNDSYILCQISEKSTDEQKCDYDPIIFDNPFYSYCQSGTDFFVFIDTYEINCKPLTATSTVVTGDVLSRSSTLTNNSVLYVQQLDNSQMCNALGASPLTKEVVESALNSPEFDISSFRRIFQSTGYYPDIAEEATSIPQSDLVEYSKVYVWTQQQDVALEIDLQDRSVIERKVPNTARIPCRCIK